MGARTLAAAWRVSLVGVALSLGAGLAACGDVVVPPEDNDTVGGISADGAGTDGGAPDTVTPKACDFGKDEQCDDGDSCTTDSCNAAGTCVYDVKTDVCKVDGECYEPGAVSTSSVCKVCDPTKTKTDWSAVACDDGNPCTNDLCDDANGCQAVPNDALPCDDGDDCTTDDHCQAGQCVATPCSTCDPVACAAQGSTCVDAACTDGACVTTAKDSGTTCLAEDACVIDAMCDGQGNCVGPWDRTNCGCKDASGCDDGKSCTEDVCDPTSGVCSHAVAGASCLIADTCYGGGAADPNNACHVCDPDQATDGWSDVLCDDGDPCTNDVCDPALGCTVTLDNLCCSEDADCDGIEKSACETIACLGNLCVKAPDLTTDGVSCDDGDPCTHDDVCTNGICGGPEVLCTPTAPCVTAVCDSADGSCQETAKASGASCDDGAPCTVGGRLPGRCLRLWHGRRVRLRADHRLLAFRRR